MRSISLRRFIPAVFLSVAVVLPTQADTSLLNVSYDVARELYKQINPAFETYYQEKHGKKANINQSHGGSSKQVLAVANGLQGDVVTMNQASDIEMLERKGLVDKNWRQEFPNNATPYTSTSVFLVHKDNPKNIKDWDDLVREDVTVIIPNPKVTGNGRYTYLAAWGYALDKFGTDEAAKNFVRDLFKNVPVLDGGGRGATTTFTQRGMGDVLVTFESETILIANELGKGKFDIVYPSISIDASAPVAIVKPVAKKRGTEALAREYLDFLYSQQGQEIIAGLNYRPRNEEVLKANAHKFPELRLFTVEDKLGGWSDVLAKHFADGAIFDQIVVNK